jgi:hypothetical protein
MPHETALLSLPVCVARLSPQVCFLASVIFFLSLTILTPIPSQFLFSLLSFHPIRTDSRLSTNLNDVVCFLPFYGQVPLLFFPSLSSLASPPPLHNTLDLTSSPCVCSVVVVGIPLVGSGRGGRNTKSNNLRSF